MNQDEPSPRLSSDAESPPAGGTQPSRAYRWAVIAWFCAPIAIVVLSAMMRVGEDRQVYLPGLSIAVPETCGLYARTGFDCPGCGLTRSFIHLTHGQIATAWHLHPTALLIFVYTLAQIPLAGLHLLRNRSAVVEAWTRYNELFLVVLVSLLGLQWVGRLFVGVIG